MNGDPPRRHVLVDLLLPLPFMWASTLISHANQCAFLSPISHVLRALAAA